MRNAIIAMLMVTALSGCGTMANQINPYYEPPSPNAMLGDRNSNALLGGGSSEARARAALDRTATYQRANAPAPYNPVLQPAVVRLMWIPDHLNKSGDLVPSHYYYLKVLKDRWAVSDAFELEAQLGSTTAGAGAVPYVTEERK
jgi:hypothetical protein